MNCCNSIIDFLSSQFTGVQLFFIASALLFFIFLIIRGLVGGKREKWRVRHSKKWLKNFRENRGGYTNLQRFGYIRKVDPFLWEEILMTCFQERGFKIKRTPYTRDFGRDGIVWIEGIKIIVQAKRYKGRISKKHIIDLNEVIKDDGKKTMGLFVHTGKTSGPIFEYINKNKNMELLSGVDKIIDFLDGKEIVIFNKKI